MKKDFTTLKGLRKLDSDYVFSDQFETDLAKKYAKIKGLECRDEVIEDIKSNDSRFNLKLSSQRLLKAYYDIRYSATWWQRMIVDVIMFFRPRPKWPKRMDGQQVSGQKN